MPSASFLFLAAAWHLQGAVAGDAQKKGMRAQDQKTMRASVQVDSNGAISPTNAYEYDKKNMRQGQGSSVQVDSNGAVSPMRKASSLVRQGGSQDAVADGSTTTGAGSASPGGMVFSMDASSGGSLHASIHMHGGPNAPMSGQPTAATTSAPTEGEASGEPTASPGEPTTPVPTEADDEHAESTCGTGEEIERPTCADEDSIIRSQGGATAHMSTGCTAWLVKAADEARGAIMMTTGHCAKSSSASFTFDYVTPCGEPDHNAVRGPSCQGNQIHAKISEDEEALYELQRPCDIADSKTPILLDVGAPEVGEGMYLIGHPQGRPLYLSHKEVHDDGHHCEITALTDNTNRRRLGGRAEYWCDTQKGNSGSPVFSTRTGHAIAIHKLGGCGQSYGANKGTLLSAGPKAALASFGIPTVDRNVDDIFLPSRFIQIAGCKTYADSVTLEGKDLDTCKTTCIDSVTCMGIVHSASTSRCMVNFKSTLSSESPCGGDNQSWDFVARNLYRTARPCNTVADCNQGEVCQDNLCKMPPTPAPPTPPPTPPTPAPTLAPTCSPPANGEGQGEGEGMATPPPTACVTPSPPSPSSPPTDPTSSPTDTPTDSPTPPTASPTDAPTAPTASPTDSPTLTPTDLPTDAPTASPTDSPTLTPTDSPTDAPTVPPTPPTASPTDAPTAPTALPTDSPTRTPTDSPTLTPTALDDEDDDDS